MPCRGRDMPCNLRSPGLCSVPGCINPWSFLKAGAIAARALFSRYLQGGQARARRMRQGVGSTQGGDANRQGFPRITENQKWRKSKDQFLRTLQRVSGVAIRAFYPMGKHGKRSPGADPEPVRGGTVQDSPLVPGGLGGSGGVRPLRFPACGRF